MVQHDILAWMGRHGILGDLAHWYILVLVAQHGTPDGLGLWYILALEVQHDIPGGLGQHGTLGGQACAHILDVPVLVGTLADLVLGDKHDEWDQVYTLDDSGRRRGIVAHLAYDNLHIRVWCGTLLGVV